MITCQVSKDGGRGDIQAMSNLTRLGAFICMWNECRKDPELEERFQRMKVLSCCVPVTVCTHGTDGKTSFWRLHERGEAVIATSIEAGPAFVIGLMGG